MKERPWLRLCNNTLSLSKIQRGVGKKRPVVHNLADLHRDHFNVGTDKTKCLFQK